MPRGRGDHHDNFGFGDPFGGFVGFSQSMSLTSSFFGGSHPFDNPFFTQPFRSLMGPSMFEDTMFGHSMFANHGSLFEQTSNAGFLDQAPPPLPNKSRGVVIRELSSDNEEEEGNNAEKDPRENPRKRSSKEPYVQHPNGEAEEKKRRHNHDFNRINPLQPQSHSFTFQSSTVTYGGLNGAYYTSSKTRRAGSNGVMLEESKEADSTTCRATHRISGGLGNKGHSLTRKLNPDGRVDTMQTLHNINEDELSTSNEAWRGNARQKLPLGNQGLGMLGNGRSSGNGRRKKQGKLAALPSTEHQQNSSGMKSDRHYGHSKQRR